MPGKYTGTPGLRRSIANGPMALIGRRSRRTVFLTAVITSALSSAITFTSTVQLWSFSAPLPPPSQVRASHPSMDSLGGSPRGSKRVPPPPAKHASKFACTATSYRRSMGPVKGSGSAVPAVLAWKMDLLASVYLYVRACAAVRSADRREGRRRAVDAAAGAGRAAAARGPGAARQPGPCAAVCAGAHGGCELRPAQTAAAMREAVVGYQLPRLLSTPRRGVMKLRCIARHGVATCSDTRVAARRGCYYLSLRRSVIIEGRPAAAPGAMYACVGGQQKV